jgi:hypothetical protein
MNTYWTGERVELVYNLQDSAFDEDTMIIWSYLDQGDQILTFGERYTPGRFTWTLEETIEIQGALYKLNAQTLDAHLKIVEQRGQILGIEQSTALIGEWIV